MSWQSLEAILVKTQTRVYVRFMMATVGVRPGQVLYRVLYKFSPIEELGCFLNVLLDLVAACGRFRDSRSP